MIATIVIPCFNRWPLTEACVESIPFWRADVDVVLVDNGSTDHTADVEVEVRNATNLGFAKACNQGAALAEDDEIVIFLNNDTVCHEGWLEALLAPFDDPSIGITGAHLTYSDGRTQHAGVSVDFFRPPGLEAKNITQDLGVGDYDVAAVTGACLAIRKPLFDHLGGFDEGYWNGYEDVDLCLKATEAGYRIRFCSESHVTHLESQSGPERWAAVRQNIDRLRAKWGEA